MQTWAETLAAAQGDSTPVTNSTTRSSIVPSNCQVITASNYFSVPGQTLYIRAFGRVSTVASAALTLSFVLGGTGASGTAVATTGAITTNATAQTNATWWLEWFLQLRSVGSAATFMHTSLLQSAVVSGTTAAPGASVYPTTAPVVGAAFDARSALQVDLTATWGAASATNTITTHGFTLQSLN